MGLLLAILILLQPTCGGLLLERAYNPLMIRPIIENPTEDTWSELWVHPGLPENEQGWTLVYDGRIPPNWGVGTYEQFIGIQTFAFQVYNFGTLVDSWVTNPRCTGVINFIREE